LSLTLRLLCGFVPVAAWAQKQDLGWLERRLDAARKTAMAGRARATITCFEKPPLQPGQQPEVTSWAYSGENVYARAEEGGPNPGRTTCWDGSHMIVREPPIAAGGPGLVYVSGEREPSGFDPAQVGCTVFVAGLRGGGGRHLWLADVLRDLRPRVTVGRFSVRVSWRDIGERGWHEYEVELDPSRSCMVREVRELSGLANRSGGDHRVRVLAAQRAGEVWLPTKVLDSWEIKNEKGVKRVRQDLYVLSGLTATVPDEIFSILRPGDAVMTTPYYTVGPHGEHLPYKNPYPTTSRIIPPDPVDEAKERNLLRFGGGIAVVAAAWAAFRTARWWQRRGR